MTLEDDVEYAAGPARGAASGRGYGRGQVTPAEDKYAPSPSTTTDPNDGHVKRDVWTLERALAFIDRQSPRMYLDETIPFESTAFTSLAWQAAFSKWQTQLFFCIVSVAALQAHLSPKVFNL